MRIEHAWYEASPYLYAAIGLGTALAVPASIGMGVPAFVLILVTATVLIVRLFFRQSIIAMREDFIDHRKYAALITQELYSEAPLERLPNVRNRPFH